MNVSFEEIGHLSVTIPAGSCKAHAVCKLDAGGKAAACSAKEAFCGVTEAIRGSQAAVQIHGFVTLPYSGSAPVPGFATLSANASGGVQTDPAGRSYLVIQVDSSAKTVTFEL